MSVQLTLPWPPTVNHLYATFRGRRILSAVGRQYHSAVAALCVAAGVPTITGSVAFRIDAYPPDARRRDLSNIIKAVEDGLTKGKAWLDDSQIDYITVTRQAKKAPGHVVVTIQGRA